MPATDSPFRGIYPMLYAYFGRDGGLDRAALRRQVAHCVEAGVQGLAVLGLATEVDKLSLEERRRLLDWTAEDLDGRLPLAVTVFGESVEAQADFLRAVEAAGADWAILQPPRRAGMSEAECLAFFSAVMATSALPVAIQNAPEYLGIGLGVESIETLRRRHDNFVLLKGEGPALTIREVIEASGEGLAVFNGRNGLELPDNLRAGCAGVIPGPETCAIQARIYELMAGGTPGGEAEAERLYREILPLLTFVMQSLQTLHCYGKRILAWQLDLGEVHDRAPALAPTAFGLDCVRRHAEALARISIETP
ncbi:MAG: dihydrodipicolinate synthase family protein [Kiloniellales bacterium]|nr:dihydrodipicolinate synthase family protein [Kiloniellales bacterium]